MYSFQPTTPDPFSKYVTIDKTPEEIVADMDAKTFFEIMTLAMDLYPPEITDNEMNQNLKRLGIAPSKTFNYDSLPLINKQALEYAVKYGQIAINEDLSRIYNNNLSNNWAMIRDNIGTYGTNYRRRAAIAKLLLGANLPQDEIFAIAYNDIDGIRLSGNKKYVLSFKKNELPPVNAFWSVTMYNENGDLIENPINRYAISPHLGALNYNVDGSLNIYIQNRNPGDGKENNWLPSPEENFYLILRLYWPKQNVLAPVWNPPGIKEVK
ncbi:hypothetical protein D3C73_1093060 [compost metagenome]